MCIKLELIKELYYDARPNKSQGRNGSLKKTTADYFPILPTSCLTTINQFDVTFLTITRQCLKTIVCFSCCYTSDLLIPKFCAWHLKVMLPLCMPLRDSWHNMKVAGKLHVPVALLPLGGGDFQCLFSRRLGGPRASPAACE